MQAPGPRIDIFAYVEAGAGLESVRGEEDDDILLEAREAATCVCDGREGACFCLSSGQIKAGCPIKAWINARDVAASARALPGTAPALILPSHFNGDI